MELVKSNYRINASHLVVISVSDEMQSVNERAVTLSHWKLLWTKKKQKKKQVNLGCEGARPSLLSTFQTLLASHWPGGGEKKGSIDVD